MQCNIMTYLARAFSLRFSFRNETNDLEEALDLRCDLHDILEDRPLTVSAHVEL